MNEITFTLALLVHKEIITKAEARTLQRSLSQGIVNSNLTEMIAKVEKAFVKDELEIERVDAKTLLD